MHNALRAAEEGFCVPVVLARAAPMEDQKGRSRFLAVFPCCETVHNALRRSSMDAETAQAMWSSLQAMMLQVARCRVLLADFKPENLLFWQRPNEQVRVWCTDFEDAHSVWDVDAPPLLVAAVHLALLGLHLQAHREVGCGSAPDAHAVSAVDLWISLVRSRARAVLSAVAELRAGGAGQPCHPAASFCFPADYCLHPPGDGPCDLGEALGQCPGLEDAFDAVLRVLDGYFRRHAPYAKTKTAERLFAAWARGDPMVDAMLRAVVAADHA